MYELAIFAIGALFMFVLLAVVAVRRSTPTVLRGPNQKIKMSETVVTKTRKENTR